ncbi:TPR-like protein [Mycena latifolia]|nr:TPR-like protein [Mycena latifolia]
MFKAGDPRNPYNPASLDIPRNPLEFMHRVQEEQRILEEILSDPEQKAEYEKIMRDDAEERERTGETRFQQMLREKRENGDYKNAFVIYTACILLTRHEPLYSLNRAAVALKLKLYTTAINDATLAIDKGDFQRAKAHFRRGQGWCFQGEWDKADEEYTTALILQPGDPNILHEFEELKRLRGLSTDD